MINKNILRLGIISGLSLLFISCANNEQFNPPTISLPHSSPIWQQHQQAVKAITHYSANGQLGYFGNNQRFSSAFDWEYLNEQQYRLHFSSLLSRSTLTIEKNANNTVIFDNKGNYYTDTNIHQLLQDIIGFDFPVEEFPNWLKGLSGNTSDYIINQQGLLSYFNYQWQGESWKAQYISYNHTLTPAMPENLLITGPDKKLKIQIKKWKF